MLWTLRDYYHVDCWWYDVCYLYYCSGASSGVAAYLGRKQRALQLRQLRKARGSKHSQKGMASDSFVAGVKMGEALTGLGLGLRVWGLNAVRD